MTDLQKNQSIQSETGKKLFNFHLQENLKSYNEQRMFFYRVNRWRFNSREHSSVRKFLSLKRPILWGFGALLIYDWTVGWYAVPASH